MDKHQLKSLLILLILLVVVTVVVIALKWPVLTIHTNTAALPTDKQMIITLPKPNLTGTVSIETALQQRRSVREYQDEPLNMQQVSQLLWAAQGVTSSDGRRTAPSAGAIYPLEVYLVVGNVTDLAAGVYHYLPKSNTLEAVVAGDVRASLANAAMGQASVGKGAINIVITAQISKTAEKYGVRAERFVAMEAGHAAENIYLQAVGLKLGTVSIGAFDDRAVMQLLNLPRYEEPLYIMPVGVQ